MNRRIALLPAWLLLLIGTQALSVADDQLGRVSGRVEDQTSAPVPHATVGLFAGHLKTEVETGADGLFTFPAVPMGLHRLAVASRGFIPQESMLDAEGRPETNIRIVLRPGPACGPEAGVVYRRTFNGGISGEIKDAETGRPVPKAQLQLWALKGERHLIAHVSSDSEGAFSFQGPAGRYAIRVKHHGYPSHQIPDVSPLPGERVRMYVRLTRRTPLCE